jgi:hypothetical protein
MNHCDFCKKEFKRETTLDAHLCEGRRRFLDRNTVTTKLALYAFQQFYLSLKTSNELKTWEEFANSSFYIAFIKFARYMIETKCINSQEYIKFVIKHNYKIDQWITDFVYERFLVEWIKNEPIWDSIRRNIETLTEWAETTNNNLNEYFQKAPDVRIFSDISKAKVTSWLLFGSGAGVTWLDSLEPVQLQVIYKFIDPEIWNIKMNIEPDFESAKTMLVELGL